MTEIKWVIDPDYCMIEQVKQGNYGAYYYVSTPYVLCSLTKRYDTEAEAITALLELIENKIRKYQNYRSFYTRRLQDTQDRNGQ